MIASSVAAALWRLNGGMPHRHLEQHEAEGELVGAKVGGGATGLLGAHVGNGAGSQARFGLRLRVGAVRHIRRHLKSSRLRQAEVHDLRAPDLVTITFSGFRSRCTMPASCAAARPSATCVAISRIRRGERASSRFRRGACVRRSTPKRCTGCRRRMRRRRR